MLPGWPLPHFTDVEAEAKATHFINGEAESLADSSGFVALTSTGCSRYWLQGLEMLFFFFPPKREEQSENNNVGGFIL